MTQKNKMEIVQRGKIVVVTFIATSEEIAFSLYDALESYGLSLVRIDLEKEWNHDKD